MHEDHTRDERYPIGRYVWEGPPPPALRSTWLGELAVAPARLRAAVTGLWPDQLDTPYRHDGWTVRQLVHHVADSHLNAYVRFKLALTEDSPRIKTYEEARWAELPDTAGTPVEASLLLVESLHRRWLVLLRALTEEQWARTIDHPDWGRVRLDYLLGMFAWHGAHHAAQVAALRERRGWLLE